MGTKSKKSSSVRKNKINPLGRAAVLDAEAISKLSDLSELGFMHRTVVNAAIRGHKIVFEMSGPYQTLHFLDGNKAKEKLPDGKDLPPMNFWSLTSGSLLDLLCFNHEKKDFSSGYLEGTTEHLLQQTNVNVTWDAKIDIGVFECPNEDKLHQTKDFKTASEVENFAFLCDLDYGYIEISVKDLKAPLWIRYARESDGVPVVDTSGKKYDDNGDYLPFTVIDYLYDAIRNELVHSDYDGYELYHLKIELTVTGV